MRMNTMTMHIMDKSVIFQLIVNITARDTTMVSSVENMSPNTSSMNLRIWLVSWDTRLSSSPGFLLLMKESDRDCILKYSFRRMVMLREVPRAMHCQYRYTSRRMRAISMENVAPMKIHRSFQLPFPVARAPSIKFLCTMGVARFTAATRSMRREISRSFPTYSPLSAMNFFRVFAFPPQ